MSSHSHSFNVILSTSEFTTLRTLADIQHMSKGATTRQTLLAAAKMIIGGVPTCADGSHCMCPHLIPRSTRGIQATFPGTEPPNPEDPPA